MQDEENAHEIGAAEPDGQAHRCSACVTEEQYEEIVRDGYPDPAERSAHIADWLRWDDWPDRAREWYERAIALGEQERGPEDPRLVKWLGRLARMELDVYRREQAEAALWRALAVANRIHEPEPPMLLEALSLLAWVALDLGRVEEARTLAERAFALWQRVATQPPLPKQVKRTPTTSREQAIAEADEDLSLGSESLAGLFAHLGDVSQARRIYLRELQTDEDLGVLVDLARLEREAGQPNEAREYIRRATAAANGPYPYSAPFWADVQSLLADIERDLGRPREARACLRRALALLKKEGTTQGYQVSDLCVKLAVLEKQVGRPEETDRLAHQALDPLRQACETLAQKYGPDDYHTRGARDHLAELERLLTAP